MLLVVAATEPELRGVDSLPDVEPLTCGVGPIDAAVTTAVRLTHQPRPTAVLHVGIAGARQASGLQPGSVVIGDLSTYCDTTSSYVARELHADPRLVQAARTAIPNAVVRTIGTSADVGGSRECDVEAMEGFGVLHAATLVGVPALEVRVISNHVEEQDRANWQFDTALDVLADSLPGLAAAVASVHDER